MSVAARWNHNIHYHPAVLTAMPVPCRRALDAGCGDGVLTRQLAARADQVVGIDLDEPSLALAREQSGDRIEYMAGDLLTYPLEAGSFDFVASVAVLHHMDAILGLRRMAELLRPGGVLAVIGLARSSLPADLPREAAAAVATRILRLRRPWWETSAPKVWPPPLTYRQMHQVAAETLPGVEYRRRLLWRYTLVWTKPGP